MPFDYDDPYAKVTCKVLKLTDKAVHVEDQLGTLAWVPRSCLHGGDDRMLEENLGDTVELRIRQWLAEREGFK